MTFDERERWDSRYQALASEPLRPPDPLLLQYTPAARVAWNQRSRALDLACGRGQNGLWLAEQGYSVDMVDISRVALEQARAEAAKRGLRTLNFLQTDLDAPALEADTYDLICVFRFLHRALIPLLRAAVRPGGRIIYETFHTGQLAEHPDFNPAYLLEPGELAAHFTDWRVLRSVETATSAQLVAIRPA